MNALSKASRLARGSTEEILQGLEMWGQKLGLERISGLLEDLGSPQLSTPCVLVAGTNGKGSVTCVLASILGAAGYRVGAYYSPHLESVRERIRIDGRTISLEQLGEHLRVLLRSCAESGKEPPTYFEAMTAAAYLEFRRSQAQVAVLEVGLGGRLDATNTSDPVLSLITSIGLDHQEHLGSTLTAISREKAGILRSGRPALIRSQGDAEVRSALLAAAAERGAHCEDTSDSVRVNAAQAEPESGPPASTAPRRDPARPRFRLRTPIAEYSLHTRLQGHYQLGNIAQAVRAAEVLSWSGFPRVDRTSIVTGVARAFWPGRLEYVPLSEDLTVLLDGAHNPAGARALAEALAGDTTRERGVDLMLASLQRKQVDETLEHLAPYVRRLVLTEPEGGPRTMPVGELHAAARGLDWPMMRWPIEATADWREALERVLRDEESGSQKSGRLVVVAGSLYLIGSVRAALRERFGVPPATTDLVL